MSMTKNKEKPMHWLVRGLVAGATLMGFSLAGHAASLGLVSKPTDITNGDTVVSYSKYTGSANNLVASERFTNASYFSYVLPGDPNTYDIWSGSYSLQATINTSGVLTGGTFSLAGDATAHGINTPTTLISGNIVNFGYAGTNFEFLVQITSGATALGIPNYGRVGIIMSNLTMAFNSAADFNTVTKNFNQAGCAPGTGACARTDNFVIPEPASVALLGIGALAARRFSRRNPQA